VCVCVCVFVCVLVFAATGIGAGAAPIRQSLTQATGADSMQDDFVPTFWFEEEYPLPPQYKEGLTGRGGTVAITATWPDIVRIAASAEW
jgi:hypothetical protein